MKQQILTAALQRYLAEKRIEAAHNNQRDVATYRKLLEGIEEVMDELKIDRSDDTMEIVRMMRPGCHHVT